MDQSHQINIEENDNFDGIPNELPSQVLQENLITIPMTNPAISPEMAQNEVLDSSTIHTADEIDIKREVPLFSTCRESLKEIQNLRSRPKNSQTSFQSVRRLSANIVAISLVNLLDENQCSEGYDSNEDLDENRMGLRMSDDLGDDEDCVIIGEIGGIVLPLRSTIDGLIKHENDLISGNKPFMETVNSIYKHFSCIFV